MASSTPKTPTTNRSRSTSSLAFLKDTPLKKDVSSSGVFIDGKLKAQKAAILEALGDHIPQVDMEFMLENILPASTVDAGKTLETLRSNGYWSDASGWIEFKGTPPKNTPGLEPNVFKRMEAINLEIRAAAKFLGEIPPLTLEFRDSPHDTPESNTEVKTRPDACCMLRTSNPIHTQAWRQQSDADDSLHWFDIVCSLEYKKGERQEEDCNENATKILWNMHHTMNVDNRRRCTFGITVENATVRVWFCSRQIVLVSTPFNFMEDPETLIRVFVSLHYAKETSLGYDPTIKHIWSKQKDLQNEITVFGTSPIASDVKYEKYITIGGMISNEAFIIRSRATRVYAAYDSSGDSKTQVVIKDYWVDANRSLEGDILSDILMDATMEERALFLTIVQHGLVQVEGENDSTENVMIRGNRNIISISNKTDDPKIYHASLFELQKRAQTEQNRRPQQKLRAALTSTNVSTSIGRSNNNGKYIEHSSKVHYRIVFKEKGTSLHHHSLYHEIQIRSIVIPTFHDVIKALGVMWRKGYIHRDISDGNIIMFNGRARLVDLEFAKIYGTQGISPVRTGNLNFMATGMNMFGPSMHNPLHDLESVWWLGIWFLYCHYPPVSLEEEITQDYAGIVGSKAMELFPTVEKGDSRTKRMDAFRYQLLSIEDFPTTSDGPRALYSLLDQLKQAILLGYSRITTPVNKDEFAIHDALAAAFANPASCPDSKLLPIDYILNKIQEISASQGRV